MRLYWFKSKEMLKSRKKEFNLKENKRMNNSSIIGRLMEQGELRNTNGTFVYVNKIADVDYSKKGYPTFTWAVVAFGERAQHLASTAQKGDLISAFGKFKQQNNYVQFEIKQYHNCSKEIVSSTVNAQQFANQNMQQFNNTNAQQFTNQNMQQFNNAQQFANQNVQQFNNTNAQQFATQNMQQFNNAQQFKNLNMQQQTDNWQEEANNAPSLNYSDFDI